MLDLFEQTVGSITKIELYRWIVNDAGYLMLIVGENCDPEKMIRLAYVTFIRGKDKYCEPFSKRSASIEVNGIKLPLPIILKNGDIIKFSCLQSGKFLSVIFNWKT